MKTIKNHSWTEIDNKNKNVPILLNILLENMGKSMKIWYFVVYIRIMVGEIGKN